MNSKRKLTAAALRMVADPAAWWEKRKWKVVFIILGVALVHTLIEMCWRDSTFFLWLAVWSKRLTQPFTF